MDSSSAVPAGGPDGQLDPQGRPARSLVGRWVTIVVDVLPAALGLALLICLVIAPATGTSTGVRVALGIWTGIWGLTALPGVWLLASVPPRKRLREASALFDRVAVFGKSLWSAVVFLGSLAVGTAVGIGTSATADEQGPAAALDAVFGGEAQVLVLRILGAVTSLAALQMVAMWLVDLGAVMRAGEAETFFRRLEQRWRGRVSTTERAAILRRGAGGATEVGAKIALPILAATTIATYWVALT